MRSEEDTANVTPRARRGRRVLLVIALLIVALLIGATIWVLWPAGRLLADFGEVSRSAPSRLYARPLELELDRPVRLRALLDELRAVGYAAARTPDELSPGRFWSGDGTLLVNLRRIPTPEGPLPSRRLEIGLEDGSVRSLLLDGARVRSAALEPVLLASYHGPDRIERLPAKLDDLPDHLVNAVLAAEDDSFFSHAGISISGVLRAAWVNLRGGSVRQGGSTLTQQLVKNLYLTQERTLARKLREAALAVALELHASKRAILEAYLNEVYLGARSGVSLVGVGAAARAWFGKDADQLTLADSAALAGMIASPGSYSPSTNPDRTLARRNWVLSRLAELGWEDQESIARAKASALDAAPAPVAPRRAAYFAEAVRAEAAARFGVETLDAAGYTLLSTLDWHDQEAAEHAVSEGLAGLDDRNRGSELQAALVSLDARTGAIRAYVGGRSYGESQFDRAADAHRQAGSAFKPVVYAAAFEQGLLSPSSLVEDEPLTLAVAGRDWSPHNDDDAFLGLIPARAALEQSRNLATVRVALLAGLDNVVDMARRLGVESRLDPVPAAALGAFELTPLELARVFATFAAAGRRAPVHGLDAVLDPDGRVILGDELPEPERVLGPEIAYMVTDVLEGVLDRGTGARARDLGLWDQLAGKTGTSNERRDAWFAGYSPDRATVVWVGHDDDSPTRFSGSRAALPIWTRFALAVRPDGGFPAFEQPPGLTRALIDPSTGELATDSCPVVVEELFLDSQVPVVLCHEHRSFFTEPLEQPEGVEVPRPENRFRRWLRKVFGKG